MTVTDPMVRRVQAAQTTLDRWSVRPMKLGTSDCVRMTAAHLRLLGYRVKLPPSGSYRTIKGAFKALKERGFESIADALNAMGLERIAPAAAVVGDVVMMPGVDGLGALTIQLTNGRVIGYHDDAPGGATALQPLEFVAAWRADPLK